jgi:hypothetical protein
MFIKCRRNFEELKTIDQKEEITKVHIQLLKTRARLQLLLDALAIDGDGDLNNSPLIRLIRGGGSNELVLDMASNIMNSQQRGL